MVFLASSKATILFEGADTANAGGIVLWPRDLFFKFYILFNLNLLYNIPRYVDDFNYHIISYYNCMQIITINYNI